MPAPKHSRHFALATALFATTALTPAHAVVVEDFDSYATGELEAVSGNVWSDGQTTGGYLVTPVGGTATVNNDGTTNYLSFGGPDTTYHYRGVDTIIADTYAPTGTFSYSIRIDNEAVNFSAGLAETPAVFSWWSDFGNMARYVDDATAGNGTVQFSVRDGDVYADNLVSINLGQWYDIRYEIDVLGGDAGLGGMDVYVDDALVYEDADFRNSYSAPLNSILLMHNMPADSVSIDNIAVEGFTVVPGDTDGDGVVEYEDDFFLIRDNFLSPVADRYAGDLDFSGTVDFLDYRAWKNAYQAAGFSLAGLDLGFFAAVPEPSSLALIGAAGCLLGAGSRRNA